MTQLRSLLFLIWFFGLTGVMAILGLPILPLGPRAMGAYANLWIRAMLFGARIICGLNYRVEGLEQVPAGGVIIAAKHQSAFETLILPFIFPRACFVLKKELLAIPIFGWYLKATQQIAIDRTAGASAMKQMIAQAKAAAAQGRKIIIFPEGTRTAPGESRAYHPGVAALYKQLEIPVVPVALNSGLFWKRNAFLKEPGTVVLRLLPAIAPGQDPRSFLSDLKEKIESESQKLLDRS